MIEEKCSVDEFTCQTKTQCIPSNAVCDGIFVRKTLVFSFEDFVFFCIIN